MERPVEKSVSIALVAIGGYGRFYVQALLDKTDPECYSIEGIVDPFADRCARLDELKAKNIPVYDTLDEFYANHSAELVTLASPIQLHCPQTCQALANGSNVLSEKPLGTSIQEAAQMIEARDKAGLNVGIGYQWSYSAAIQELKGDILNGRFGKPIRLTTIVLWPRNAKYYGRNNWAGAKQDGDGNWILDSPVNNATAHYLHNMYYVLGREVDSSARPAKLTAELYRANDITNFDTGAMRSVTEDGVEVLYYASHAVRDPQGPVFMYEFENGTVHYEGKNSFIHAKFADGTLKDYGDPFYRPENKLWDSMKAVRGEKKIVCPPEAAASQTLAVNGMQESKPEIVEFPKDLVVVEGEPGEQLTLVEGLGADLMSCYDEARLPSELGFAWAAAGKEVDLTDYDRFPREG